jgi:uncharacterized protein YbbK (DUF523 family)
MEAPVLVSACLVGFHCRFDGEDKTSADVFHALEEVQWIPVCPEVKAGMKTPRLPMSFSGGSGDDALRGTARVIREDGKDMTQPLVESSKVLLNFVRKWEVKTAILKDKSPSCGVRQVYFGEKLERGAGVFAALLKDYGIKVLHENEVERLRKRQ